MAKRFDGILGGPAIAPVLEVGGATQASALGNNHKPGLGSVDEAICRRIHLIPFDIKIPEGERDPDLPEKLKSEWPGILAWMVDGCLKWQATGLKPPDAVKKATETYLESEDSLGQWLEECCEKGSQHWEGSSACSRLGRRGRTERENLAFRKGGLFKP